MPKSSWNHDFSRALIIAEAGVNHNGQLDLAYKLVDIAKKAGADAIKFQTFDAKTLVSETAQKAEYQERTGPQGETQRQMLERLQLSHDETRQLRDYCKNAGINFMSTPFGFADADLLGDLGVDIFKVGSGDLTYHQFLAHIASKGKPMIISTGMATLAEVKEAVSVIEAAGNPPLAILHCVSNYPAAPEQCNLRAMQTMRAEFGCEIGWSDHTLGGAVTCAAIAMGATLIEKHFTIDKNMEGPDHRASLEPGELTQFVNDIRAVEAALGDGNKIPTPAETGTANVARRSVVASVDIAKGEILTTNTITIQRPGTGVAPKDFDQVLGRTAKIAIAAGDPIRADMLS